MTVRLIAALVLPLLVTQGSFEGKVRMRSIEMTLEEPGLKESWLDVAPNTLAAREDVKVEESAMQVKNNVMRFDNKDGEAGYALLDFTRHVIVMVMADQRMYMELPLGEGGGPTPQQRTPQGTSVVRALGQTKRINGINATGYEVRGPDLIVRGWMTQDFPGLTGTLRAGAAQMGEHDPNDPEEVAMSQLMTKGFPVLVITLTDRTIKVEETLSIERTALSADMFKVPAGFTKQSIPGR